MIHFFHYVRNRLLERSTWISIGLGVPIAAALSPPWSYCAIAIAAIGALTPDPKTPAPS